MTPGGWAESVIVRALIGAIVGTILGASLGALSSRRSPGRRAALLAVVLGALLAGLAPKLSSVLLGRRPPGRTPFEKYGEEVRLILRASSILRSWAARREPSVDVAAAVQALGASGVRRLPDGRVVRLAIIGGRMLGGVGDEECARLAEGKGTRYDQERLFASLDDQQVAEVAEGHVAAMEAEVADDPPAIVPSDASIDAAVKALTSLEPADFEKYVTPGTDSNAPPAARCRMLRYVYQKLEAVPDEHRATLVRAVQAYRLGAAPSQRAAGP